MSTKSTSESSVYHSVPVLWQKYGLHVYYTIAIIIYRIILKDMKIIHNVSNGSLIRCLNSSVRPVVNNFNKADLECGQRPEPFI